MIFNLIFVLFILPHQPCWGPQLVGTAAPRWAASLVKFWRLPGPSNSADNRGQPGEEGDWERSKEVRRVLHWSVISAFMGWHGLKRQVDSCSPCRKAATHDDEIQHLYEEMEQQIKNEKDRIVLQVKECSCFRFIVSSMNCTSFFFFFTASSLESTPASLFSLL